MTSRESDVRNTSLPKHLIAKFACSVREVEDCRITLTDGCELAASLWIPSHADEQPVPGLLEIIPYRRRDERAVRDSSIHRYLAGHGYACVRVDMRGTGDSAGLQVKMIQAGGDNRDDNVQVVDWIARQPWCNGAVGMFGLSWGGNNAFFTAAKYPDALKAIAPCSFTYDSYSYGLSWKGGCVLNWNFLWSTLLIGYQVRPPDPATAGDRWRQLWEERLNGHEPQIQFLLGNQRRNAFWDTRRVADLENVTCPVYAFAGWCDSNYANVVPSLLANLKGPRRGLIGPWGHQYGHLGIPGPAIGFLKELLRWFDAYLKGVDTGIVSEPMYRVWMREALPAKALYPDCPGRWVAEREWPSPRISHLTLTLSPGGLEECQRSEVALSCRSPQTVGIASGEVWPWFAYSAGPELPGDQRVDDAGSLCFDTAPLPERLEILGAPIADLDLAVDRGVAFLAVRFCDVSPDGVSRRVSYGLLNLPRRENDRAPMPLRPGARYRVRVRLDDTAYAFRAGHRMRLAVSTSYWPMVWPTPEPATLTLFTGVSTLQLPIRPSSPDDVKLRDLGAPEAAIPVLTSELAPPKRSRIVSYDLGTGQTTLSLDDDNGQYRLEAHGLEVASASQCRFSIRDDEPTSARAEANWQWRFQRGDWRVRTETESSQWCSQEEFFYVARLTAYEDDRRCFERTWDFRFPRDLI